MKAVTKTDFQLPGQVSKYTGKVRDVYSIDDSYIVMVATDRISAFDVVLPEGIPYKGQVLNQIASKFLDLTEDIIPNWKIAEVDPMVTVGLRCEPYKVEMVVRGYLAGHAWREYRDGKRTLCGVALPDGLRENDRLPEPIITPTTKAAEGHDEDHDRVRHRRLDLALDLLRLFEEFRETRERDFQRARGFARARQVDGEVVEDPRVLRQRVGERRAALDRLAHPLQDGPEPRDHALLREDAQAAQQREARLHERRQLAREDRQVLGLHALGLQELGHLELDVQRALLLLLAAFRDEGLGGEVVLAQDELRLGHVLSLDDAALLVAGGVLGHVVEPLHGGFPGWWMEKGAVSRQRAPL